MLKSTCGLVLVALLLAATPLQAITYTVNDAGSGADSNLNDNTCSTATPANGTSCTLRAAIQEANNKAGPHTIKFAAAITRIQLSASLPQIIAAVTLDGTNPGNTQSGGRVEIDGSGIQGCLDLRDVTTALNPNGAEGSTVKNLVVRRCGGDGISLSGNGYTITGNRIGTNVGATSASSDADANVGAGISVSGSAPIPATLPTLASLIATLPQGYAGVGPLQAALQAALSVITTPTLISGNVVSGNRGNGIWIFGQGTVNTIIAGNIVGLSQNGLSAVPNGRGPGGASNRAGIRVSGTAYGNFIGPGNIVSGNLGDGIAVDPGSVRLPNFVAGNLVGLGSGPADVGNAENGVAIDAFPKTSGAGANNPTGIAIVLGPANTISDNRSEAPSSDLDVEGADTAGGVLITASSSNARVYGNVIGLATFPGGSTPLGQLNYGNAGNGIVVTTSNNDIRYNLILANRRHGIVVRGSSVVNNVIRGNFIGVSLPTGLSAATNLGNVGDGIHVTLASGTTIGGPAPIDANIIAANSRNGIAIRNGSPTNGWANLIQRNKIYGNAASGAGVEIDLERILNTADPLDQLENPGTNYANFDQHRPALCGGASDPPICAGAGAPEFDGGATRMRWTVLNRPNASNAIRIEFYANPPGGADQMFLGEQIVSTDAEGRPVGAGCIAGLCTVDVGGSADTVGMQVVATSTDLTPSDVPPTGDQPAPLPLTPANNTSEFSDPVVAGRKLAISTAPPLPAGLVGQPYLFSFSAIGGSGSYVNWVVSNGNAPTGLVMAPASGTLGGTATAVGTYNFTVQVTDSVGATAITSYAITITPQPPLVITTPSPLPNCTVGSAYQQTFSASGGSGVAGNWQLMSGALPDGLALAPATGLLSGTPTEVGSFNFNVQVTDAAPTTAIRAYALSCVPAPVPLAISTASPLAGATQGASYGATLAAIGGSGVYANWSLVQGALPAGLQLNSASGAISGKATVNGSFNFSVRVTDSVAATATKDFALAVAAPPPAPPPFTATPAELDFGNVNVGRSASANIVLRNVSSAAVSPQILAANPGDEFVTSEGTCTGSVNPGATCTMSVTFTPSAGGGRPYAASSTVCRPPALFGQCLPIIIGQPAPVLARLRYAGVGSGSLAQVAPTRINFGSQLVGTQTNVVVSITNPTAGLLTYNPQLLLSNPAGFSIPTQSCGLGLVGTGLTCTITFRFAPTVPGAAMSMTRIRLSSATLTEYYDIELAGTGITTATPSYTAPMRLDFGDVGVGAVATIPVTTRNAAGQALTVTAAPFGSADALTWTRVPQAACLAPIANGATCRHDYNFSPRLAGGYSINTQLAVTGTGVNQSVPLSLSGTGVGSLVEVTPLNLDLGLVAIGNIATGQVTITNTSANTLARTFSGSAPFVSSTTCGASLVAGASCVINYSLVADGDPLGPVESEATLLFSNVVPGNSETVTVNLRAQVTDLLFANGFE